MLAGTGRNSPLEVVEKVIVTDLLWAAATIVTVELFFLAKVLFPHETILRLSSAWPNLMTIEYGIEYFSILETTSYKNTYSIYFLATSGISTFVEVSLRRTYPIRRSRLWAQEKDSRSRYDIVPGRCLINAFAADLATDWPMTEPQLKRAVI